MEDNTSTYATKAISGTTNTNIPSNIIELLLDGQQRTTSAFQAFFSMLPSNEYWFYFDYNQYIEDIISSGIPITDQSIDTYIEDNIEEWIIALDPDNAISSNLHIDVGQLSKGYLPLTSILNPTQQITDCCSAWIQKFSQNKATTTSGQIDITLLRKYNDYQTIFNNKFYKNVTSYDIHGIKILSNTSTNIICTIFETINTSGQSLTIWDLLNAKCYKINFNLNDELENNSLPNKTIISDFIDINDLHDVNFIGMTIIKLISIELNNSCKKNDLLEKLNPTDIKTLWSKNVDKLSNSIEYIIKNFGVIGIKYFPYKDSLTVIAHAIDTIQTKYNNNPIYYNLLNKWYWGSVFNDYFDKSVDTKIKKSLEDLLGVNGWFNNHTNVPTQISSIRSSIKTNPNYFDYLNKLDSLNNAKYKGILNLLINNSIADFFSPSNPIKTIKYSELDDHHICPSKFLKRTIISIGNDEINTIINKTLIYKKTNIQIGDSSPAVYINNQNFNKMALNNHLIDSNLVCCVKDKSTYDAFINDRKNKIIEIIKNAIF